jgi:hypothetical protein
MKPGCALSIKSFLICLRNFRRNSLMLSPLDSGTGLRTYRVFTARAPLIRTRSASDRSMRSLGISLYSNDLIESPVHRLIHELGDLDQAENTAFNGFLSNELLLV